MSNNAEEMLFKIHFSRKWRKANPLGYQKGNTKNIFGNTVGEEWEKQNRTK